MRSGHDDRRPLEPFRSTRALVVSDLTELGAKSDIVGICVVDDADVVEVFSGGLFDGLAPGSLVLIHSTVLPETCRRLAEEGRHRGIALMDAPVCGGAQRALAGQLLVSVGGEVEDFERALPVLSTYGGLVRHCGPVGSGQVVKLVYNLAWTTSAGLVDAASELGQQLGVASELLAEFFGSLTYPGFVGAGLVDPSAGPSRAARAAPILAKDVAHAAVVLAERDIDPGYVGALARHALDTLERLAKS